MYLCWLHNINVLECTDIEHTTCGDISPLLHTASKYGAHTLRQLQHLYRIIPIILYTPALELNNTVFTRPHHRTHAGSGESSPQPHIPPHPI